MSQSENAATDAYSSSEREPSHYRCPLGHDQIKFVRDGHYCLVCAQKYEQKPDYQGQPVEPLSQEWYRQKLDSAVPEGRKESVLDEPPTIEAGQCLVSTGKNDVYHTEHCKHVYLGNFSVWDVEDAEDWGLELCDHCEHINGDKNE